MKQIDFKRISNDINGNPRYVCHFLNLLSDKDIEDIKQDYAASLAISPMKEMSILYYEAVQRAKKLGGKKYHNKQYGGGIVFQSCNIDDLERRILNTQQLVK